MVVPIPLGTSAYQRTIAREPEIRLLNRFFEFNPTNLVDQVTLLTRPYLETDTTVGDGPISNIYSQDGAFDSDAFIVSDNDIYRRDFVTKVNTKLTGTVGTDGTPSLVATVVGGVSRLYVADGTSGFQFALDDNILTAISTPDSVGIVYVAAINGYVICVVNNSRRYYWITPGSVTIDALNFAEAERSGDKLLNVEVLGDNIFFFGEETTEIWFPTGNLDAPFQRIQGRLFDRGIWEGTALRVADQIILVGNDGIVYSILGGPQRISSHGIEERIKKAMAVSA